MNQLFKEKLPSTRLFKEDSKNEIYLSCFENQSLLLQAILNLHNKGERIHLDPMFNLGGFYNLPLELPLICGDINKKYCRNFVKNMDATNLKSITNTTIKSMVLDPPFLWGLSKRDDKHTGKSYHEYTKSTIERFSHFKDKKSLVDFYKKIIKEANRVLIKKGLIIFKCQDMTHNNKQHFISFEVKNLLEKLGFEIIDLAILNIKNKIFNPTLKQRHLRKTHTYFWVARKK